LVWPYGVFDPVVHHLGQTLVASLEQPHHTSKFFLDHVLHALNCHFCLLLWRRDGIGSAISGWTLLSTDAKSYRVIRGSSGRQDCSSEGRRSMRIIRRPLCPGL
jgi:hypothetical protein